MKTMTVRDTQTFNALPEIIYEIFMDSKKHSTLTGSRARISSKVGGKFEVYNGDIHGKNIELSKNKKIVQSWRTKEWTPKSHYSTLTIKLEKIKNKTRLTMVHDGVPDYDYTGVKEGWKEYYWMPLKQMLKSDK